MQGGEAGSTARDSDTHGARSHGGEAENPAAYDTPTEEREAGCSWRARSAQPVPRARPARATFTPPERSPLSSGPPARARTAPLSDAPASVFNPFTPPTLCPVPRPCQAGAEALRRDRHGPLLPGAQRHGGCQHAARPPGTQAARAQTVRGEGTAAREAECADFTGQRGQV